MNAPLVEDREGMNLRVMVEVPEEAMRSAILVPLKWIIQRKCRAPATAVVPIMADAMDVVLAVGPMTTIALDSLGHW